MSLFDGLFGQPFGMIGDARALSDGELAQMRSAQAYMMRNAVPSIEMILGMQNYRRPIVIPGGWAYWYDIGDEQQ